MLELQFDSACSIQRSCSAALLLVVEGANDVEFLSRLARRLRVERADVPDLGALIDSGQLVIVPAGGGDPVVWAERLSPLCLFQYHLYDREQEPHTTARQRAITKINQRLNCQAALLTKRSLENYLHPAAILAAGGPDVSFGDEEAVAMLVAEQRFSLDHPNVAWGSLPRRAQHRLAYAAKRWLNRSAIEQMTAGLLAERDPAGELLDHLRAIATLADRVTSQ